MKKRIALFSILFSPMLISPASASNTGAGAISSPVGISNGAVLFSNSGTRSTPPACQNVDAPARWAIDASTPQGQSQLSVLLTAYAFKKQIFIYGTGTCSIWSDTETVSLFVVVE